MESDKKWLNSDGRLCVHTTHCRTSKFDFTNWDSKLEIVDSSLNFLSVGPLPLRPNVTTNRLYGHLDILGIAKRNIQTIRLLVTGEYGFSAEAPLSFCAERMLRSPLNPEQEFHFSLQQNFVNYLFDLPYQGARPSLLEKDLTYRVQVDYLHNGVLRSVFSPVNQNTVEALVSPELPLNYTTGISDDYDISCADCARTGGDKWIRLTYSDNFHKILSLMNGVWKVDDISSSNSGYWIGHVEHRDGTDADVTFSFNLLNLNSEYDTWNDFTKKISTFLGEISQYYKYIESIYLYRSASTNAQKHISRKFDYRCFKGRFIDMSSGQFDYSLMRDVKKHADHLHISFIHSNGNLNPGSINPSVDDVSNFDLGDFTYTLRLNPEPQLEISPRVEFPTENFKVYSRIQDEIGYDELSKEVLFAEYPDNQKDLYSSEVVTNLRYLSVAIVKSSTGACVSKEVLIDEVLRQLRGTRERSIKWTYKLDARNKYTLEVL